LGKSKVVVVVEVVVVVVVVEDEVVEVVVEVVVVVTQIRLVFVSFSHKLRSSFDTLLQLTSGLKFFLAMKNVNCCVKSTSM
jgi:hypothetical protein